MLKKYICRKEGTKNIGNKEENQERKFNIQIIEESREKREK